MAVWYAPTDPSRVYYGTDTRAHLLLVGALLALVPAERLRAATSARGEVLGALALAIGVGAMLVVDDQSAFLYRGGMFLNALLVAGVLASVAYQPGTRLARALGVAPFRGLGRISYGVYLWSWPVIVLVTTGRTGLDGAALVALQLALIVAVPLLSYRLLEQPVRRWRPRPVPVLAGALAAAVAVGVAAVVVVPKPTLDPVFATAGPDLADFEPVAAPPVTAPPVTAPPVTAPPVTAGPPATVAPPATAPSPTTTRRASRASPAASNRDRRRLGGGLARLRVRCRCARVRHRGREACVPGVRRRGRDPARSGSGSAWSGVRPAPTSGPYWTISSPAVTRTSSCG